MQIYVDFFEKKCVSDLIFLIFTSHDKGIVGSNCRVFRLDDT